MSSYTFESTAAGVYNPYIRMTAYENAVTAFSFTVASGTWTYPGAPPVNSNEINVQNDNYGVDRYLATFNPAMSTPPLPLGVSLHFIQFMLTDVTGTLLTNESLVTSASVLDAFGSKSGRFVFSNGDQPFFSISSIASPGVPEIDPAGMGSVIALVTGALGLFERRRRRT